MVVGLSVTRTLCARYGFESEIDMLGDPHAATICCQCYNNAAQCALNLKDYDRVCAFACLRLPVSAFIFLCGNARPGAEDVRKVSGVFPQKRGQSQGLFAHLAQFTIL